MVLRLDELTAPVKVGQFYLVPTVHAQWYDMVRYWPVIGPQHNDAQCIKFKDQHYHLDVRFVDIFFDDDNEYRWGASQRVFASPLTTSNRINIGGLPAPVWRRRKCRRLANPGIDNIKRMAANEPGWVCHFNQWEGKHARRDERGWVCPHRSVSLADHPAVGGVITCPLHLLRIDAVTGRVLPQALASNLSEETC